MWWPVIGGRRPGCLCPYCWTRPANSKWPRPLRGGAMLCSARVGGAGSRRPAQPYHCTRLWTRGPCNGGPTKRLKACGATRLAASRYLWRAVRPRMATCWRPSRKRCCNCTAEPASLRRLQERRTLQVREPTSPAECRALDQRGRKRWRPGTMRRLQRRPGSPPHAAADARAARGAQRAKPTRRQRRQTQSPPRRRAARPSPSHARGRLGARVAQESLHAAVASRPDARCPEGRAVRRPDRGTARPELWKLFLLAPRMLLVPRAELDKRVALLAAGQCRDLLDAAAEAAAGSDVPGPPRANAADDDAQRRAERAAALAHLGELSAASAALPGWRPWPPCVTRSGGRQHARCRRRRTSAPATRATPWLSTRRGSCATRVDAGGPQLDRPDVQRNTCVCLRMTKPAPTCCSERQSGWPTPMCRPTCWPACA